MLILVQRMDILTGCSTEGLLQRKAGVEIGDVMFCWYHCKWMVAIHTEAVECKC